MKKTSNLGSDAFAAFQIIMAYYFAIPQIERMFVSVKGVTINWLLCASVFIFLNLFLSVGSYRKTHERAVLQTIIIYGNWVVLLVPMVIITFVKCSWTSTDSLILSLIMISAIAVVIWGKVSGRDLKDSLVRGLLVGLFRVVPHCYLAYCIFNAGSSDGISGNTVLAGNITATSRVLTLYLSGRKSRWEKGVKASFIAECANEGSWIVTSLMWFVYR